MVLLGGWLFFNRSAAQKQEAMERMKTEIAPLKKSEADIKKLKANLDGAKASVDRMTLWLQDRSTWASLLSQLRDVFQEVENAKQKELTNSVGIWVEKLVPKLLGNALAGVQRWEVGEGGGEQAPEPTKGSRGPDMNAFPDTGGFPPGGATSAVGGQNQKNQIDYVKLYCRGVNRTSLAAAANNELVYALVEALRKKPELFEPEHTRAQGKMEISQDDVTFTFQIILKLQRPIEL
jgi:hypothetical protein